MISILHRLNPLPHITWSLTADSGFTTQCLVISMAKPHNLLFSLYSHHGVFSFSVFNLLLFYSFRILQLDVLLVKNRNRSQQWSTSHPNKGFYSSLALSLVSSYAISLEQPSWYPDLNERPLLKGSHWSLHFFFMVPITALRRSD